MELTNKATALFLDWAYGQLEQSMGIECENPSRLYVENYVR